MAARMQRGHAVKRLTRGPCGRRRLELHALLARVLLCLHRSPPMPPWPTLGTSPPTCFFAALLEGRAPRPSVGPLPLRPSGARP